MDLQVGCALADLAWTPPGSPALGGVQVCGHEPTNGEVHLMVTAQTQEGKWTHTDTFEGDAQFTVAHISLAEAGHMAKPQSQGTK